MRLFAPPRFVAIAASLAIGALVLGGCASTERTTGDSGMSAGSASTDSGFPVSVTSKLGTATIESKPKRVATVSWTNQDVALALGVVPVTMASATYGDDNSDGILPWTLKAATKLGGKLVLHNETDGIPYEKISDSRPDVILGGYSGLTQEDYDTLSKIAPVVAYPGAPYSGTWKSVTTVDAKALGRTKQAKAKIAATEKLMKSTAAKYPDLAGKSVAVLTLDAANPDVVTYYSTKDARVEYLTELGLTNSPSIMKLSKDNPAFYGTVSAENADSIDADIVVLYLDSKKQLDTLAKNPLLSQIRAIKRGSVVALYDPTFIMATSAPSLLSIPWSLDKYLALLGGAADKVG